jgi:tetratricopeptide (TPR) repeat protein
VECVENLSPSEYSVFKDTVLNPIQDDDSTVATSYMKQGNKWWLDHATVKFEKNQYTLIAVVPYSEVIKSSTKMQDSINRSLVIMIIVFVIVFAALLVLFVLFVRKLISCIVDPINDLRDLCNLIKNDDLEKDIPTEPTSLDMKVLLSAFSRLMVALRFGSDSYVRGDNGRARAVFKEALELFTSINNQRGIGASLNNLAAVELSDGNYRLAEELYVKSIQNAEELITAEQNEAAKTKLQRIRSDRKGNLAALYLRENSFPQAFAILEEMLEEDKSSGYIRGYVVKQGTLGQYYLKQGELKSAERVFESCLTFVRSRNEALFDGLHWNKDEAEAAEQIALFNMANLFAQQQLSADLIEGTLVEALYRPSSMHLQATRNIMTELIELLKKHTRIGELMQLTAKEFSFELFDKNEKVKVSNAQKRIMFAIDYSGSMSGGKIRSVVENVRNIFTTYMDDHDYIGLLRFNHRSDVLLGLTMKGGNEQLIDASFDQLLSPFGGTRLYNAIGMAFHQFGDAKSGAYKKCNDWVVVWTDGMSIGFYASIHLFIYASIRQK